MPCHTCQTWCACRGECLGKATRWWQKLRVLLGRSYFSDFLSDVVVGESRTDNPGLQWQEGPWQDLNEKFVLVSVCFIFFHVICVKMKLPEWINWWLKFPEEYHRLCDATFTTYETKWFSPTSAGLLFTAQLIYSVRVSTDVKWESCKSWLSLQSHERKKERLVRETKWKKVAWLSVVSKPM